MACRRRSRSLNLSKPRRWSLKSSKPPRRCSQSPNPRKTAAAGLTDDLLAEIFIRVADPDDLVRASAACPPFLRIITDPEFVRRLHPPSLLGFVSHGEFHPIEPPNPSATAATAMAQAADFPGGKA